MEVIIEIQNNTFLLMLISSVFIVMAYKMETTIIKMITNEVF